VAGMAGSAAVELAWQPTLPAVVIEDGGSPASWSGDLLALLVTEEAFETSNGEPLTGGAGLYLSIVSETRAQWTAGRPLCSPV